MIVKRQARVGDPRLISLIRRWLKAGPAWNLDFDVACEAADAFFNLAADVSGCARFAVTWTSTTRGSLKRVTGRRRNA
jgi:hypothetical protein